jgi:O-antigen/teichoic acid export membrane protein
MGVGQCKIAFNRYWAADMAGRWEVRDLDGLHRVVRRTGQLTLIVSLTMAVVLIAAGRWIFRLPGEGFAGAYPLMLILLAGHLMMAYYAANITLLQMTDQERAATGNYSITLGAALIGYFVLTPLAGPYGAAIVTSGATVLLSLLMTRSCVKRLNCNPGAL